MVINTNAFSPKIGEVSGVNVWQMPTHTDVRGRLFKAYTRADTKVFPIPFNTYEHFFTQSSKHVFRGMHFQGQPHAVSKIVSIVHGKAIDFLFDMRENSETFGKLQIVHLDDAKPESIFIPVGVAHGYLALEEKTIISYAMDGAYCGKCDDGFSGELLAEFFPIHFSAVIKSPRDAALVEFQNLKYLSDCDRLRDP